MRTSSLFGLPKVLAVAIAAMALGGGAYAFTASNTISGTSAAGYGEQTSAMSGYTASSVVWTPDSTDPTKVQKVTFSLSTVTAGTAVYAGADNGTTIGWSSVCSQGSITAGAATETCTFATEPPVSTVTKLAVSAAN
jgi:hypothetical protein